MRWHGRYGASIQRWRTRWPNLATGETGSDGRKADLDGGVLVTAAEFVVMAFTPSEPAALVSAAPPPPPDPAQGQHRHQQIPGQNSPDYLRAFVSLINLGVQRTCLHRSALM
jgi:hypothetical protein